MTPPSNYRSEFDLDESQIYLNSGTQSICPRSVLMSVYENLKAYERNPTYGLIHAWEELWHVQSALGSFLGARPEDLFLRPNVTSAMNALIQGAKFSLKGGEILVSDTEYQAVTNVCRFRAEHEGLSLRSFHLPGRPDEMKELTEASLCEQIVRELRPETRMLVISHVMTGTGLAIPLPRLARETRARGVLLAVDGAHGVGALPLDFKQLEDVDFYGGNLHKWVMGSKGTAFGWVHPLHQESLVPLEAGWTTFESGTPYNRFGAGHRFAQKHLQTACVDFAPFMALKAAFSFWRLHGPDNIRSRIRSLQTSVEDQMKLHTTWTLITPSAGPLRGPLLSYDLPPHLESLGYELMARVYREHHLQIASSKCQGRWVLRISPHIYNTEDEIARAARLLGQFA